MRYSPEEKAWIWLGDSLGAAVAAADQIVYRNGGPANALEAARAHRLNAPEDLGPEKLRALLERCSEEHISSVIERCASKEIEIVTRSSASYPELLREIYDPPIVLYVMGRLPERLPMPIAVIGSRKCSDYGKRMAEVFGRALADNGACVVSGMALGCDAHAAMGALASSSEFPTIAVLAGGVDVVYPRSEEKLYRAILERGAVISEMKPGTTPIGQSFPRRNRIISGMSRGVLVVEAGEKSGTRITVDFALEQGREVFAVPARLTDVMSAGSNALIKNGEAKPVFGVDDILLEFGTFTAKAAGLMPRPKLPFEQERLCDELAKGEKNRDDLSEITGFSVEKLNILLTEMELSGIIKQLPNGEYAIDAEFRA